MMIKINETIMSSSDRMTEKDHISNKVLSQKGISSFSNKRGLMNQTMFSPTKKLENHGYEMRQNANNA